MHHGHPQKALYSPQRHRGRKGLLRKPYERKPAFLPPRPTGYFYHLNYQDVEEELCRLEVRSLFGQELLAKGVLSPKSLNPSLSPFLRSRIKILYSGQSIAELLETMHRNPLVLEEFRIDYLRIQEDEPDFQGRFDLLTDLGMAIEGEPDLKEPKAKLAVICYQGQWLFGPVMHNQADWQQHAQKPHPYSNSFGIKLAKALVNIAAQGDFRLRLVDPCCGAGTVLLEGLYGGYDIQGFDINKKVAWDAQRNLEHFGFSPRVQCADITDIADQQAYFDSAIVDLPYGLFTVIKDHTQQLIIRAAQKLAQRLVFVSHDDISSLLEDCGLRIADRCTLAKRRVAAIVRHIWVCESTEQTNP
jgi:tRNA (guanine10-N2)-dimethyltransferase